LNCPHYVFLLLSRYHQQYSLEGSTGGLISCRTTSQGGLMTG
jgi:hypothetical protein